MVDNTLRLLDLLAELRRRGNVFRFGMGRRSGIPNLVQRIANDGHELASHSYWHQLVYELTPDEFRADLRRSKQAIEDASGVSVTCYQSSLVFPLPRNRLGRLTCARRRGFPERFKCLSDRS